MRGQRTKTAARILSAVIVVGLGMVAPGNAAPTGCVVAVVPDPFVLPDGVERPAGALKICVARELSPVAAVHRLSIDGMPVAYAFSTKGWSEVEAPAEPFVLFHRSADGALRVIGYAWPEGAAARTYLLANPRPDWTQASRAIGSGVSPAAMDVVIAAARIGL